MSTSNKLSNISRRDLFKVAGRYGMSCSLAGCRVVWWGDEPCELGHSS